MDAVPARRPRRADHAPRLPSAYARCASRWPSSTERRSFRRMSTGTQDVESALIESVCERVRERVAPEEVAEAEAFVRQYYRRAPAADLKGREPVDLYGAALAHWAFGKDREPGETRVRAYNPTFEQHGWQSPHTAIDIVSDDMPFLVDSVSMELSRRELGIHVLVHPVVGDESYMHIEVDRQADGLRRRSSSAIDGRARAGARRGRGLAADARAHAGAARRADARRHGHGRSSRRRGRCSRGSPTTTSPTSATASTSSPRTRCTRSRAPGSACCAAAGPQSTGFAKLPVAVRALAREPDPLVLAKATTRSPVHRPAYLDYIGVKKFDDEGNVVGERRFLGLYTTGAYREVPANIPVLRQQGAGRPRARRVRARQPRRQGARSRSSTRSRATSCSRSASTTCTRSRSGSSSWASASACGCSCARTATSASSRASSSSRATASTRPTGSRSARCCPRRSAPSRWTGACG